MALVVTAAVLLGTSWITTVLAEVEADGDELLLVPMFLGLGLIAILGWAAHRRRASGRES